MFILKDGMKWKEFPAYAVANPEAGMYAGRLIPSDPLAQELAAPGLRTVPVAR